jgi:ketosteroid isomerase-like protein
MKKMLGSFPRRIGNQLCFADLRQQKDLADPETTQKLLAGAKADEGARNNNDPAAFAANYTRDAFFLRQRGQSPVGERWNADVLQQLHPKKRAGKVDGNALQVIGTAGNELLATGEWSETGQGQNGEPLPIKGYPVLADSRARQS